MKSNIEIVKAIKYRLSELKKAHKCLSKAYDEKKIDFETVDWYSNRIDELESLLLFCKADNK